MSISESRPYDFAFDPIYADPNSEACQHQYFSANDMPKNQYKYFRKPLASGKDIYMETCRLDKSAVDILTNEQKSMSTYEPFSKDAEVQTIFRDSNSQTDPYSPDYIISDSINDLDILLLEKYKFNTTVTIDSKEIKAIKESKLKKLLYDSLPPFTTPENIALRKKLLEDQELKEWNLNELEIDEMRHLKLKVMQEERAKREERQESLNSERLNNIRKNKLLVT